LRESQPWKFVEALRANKILGSIPILLVADSKPSSADAERAVACRAQGFQARPLDQGTLEAEIRRVLEGG
jgi:CheY-like chemotaxis protein